MLSTQIKNLSSIEFTQKIQHAIQSKQTEFFYELFSKKLILLNELDEQTACDVAYNLRADKDFFDAFDSESKNNLLSSLIKENKNNLALLILKSMKSLAGFSVLIQDVFQQKNPCLELVKLLCKNPFLIIEIAFNQSFSANLCLSYEKNKIETFNYLIKNHHYQFVTSQLQTLFALCIKKKELEDLATFLLSKYENLMPQFIMMAIKTDSTENIKKLIASSKINEEQQNEIILELIKGNFSTDYFDSLSRKAFKETIPSCGKCTIRQWLFAVVEEKNPSMDLIKIACENSKTLDLTKSNFQKKSLLWLAIMNKQYEFATYLIRSHLNKFSTYQIGQAYNLLIDSHNEKYADLILEKLDPTRLEEFKSYLLIAVDSLCSEQKINTDRLDFLLLKKVDVPMSMFCALQKNNVEVIKYLFEKESKNTSLTGEFHRLFTHMENKKQNLLTINLLKKEGYLSFKK